MDSHQSLLLSSNSLDIGSVPNIFPLRRLPLQTLIPHNNRILILKLLIFSPPFIATVTMTSLATHMEVFLDMDLVTFRKIHVPALPTPHMLRDKRQTRNLHFLNMVVIIFTKSLLIIHWVVRVIVTHGLHLNNIHLTRNLRSTIKVLGGVLLIQGFHPNNIHPMMEFITHPVIMTTALTSSRCRNCAKKL
jgi:hypothetical protein